MCLEAVHILRRICNDLCRGTDACKISVHLFGEVTIGDTRTEHLNVHSIRICYLFKTDLRLELRDRSVLDWTALRLLYLTDEIHNPVITLKTVGRQ